MNIPFDAYETIIGFECHVQLNTRSKLFSRGPNIFGAAPNTLVDIVDAGLPGVLPVLNKSAVEDAIFLGLALSCEINRESIFARKHYFYPDLPKGYQISQFDKPICEHGMLTFMVDGEERSIRIRRIHLEEDAGKNTHVEGVHKSYVDFNRAGTPLLEVVSEPDLKTPKEAMEAIRALRQMVTFLQICDGNMQEGSLRADINVSVRKKGEEKLGTRTETKNLNSFRYIGQAISFEARRQIIELESGNKITQETRLWDPNAHESRSMRSKEEAHDYRYFPDPDLLPLVISNDMMGHISHKLPELPHKKFLKFQSEFGLSLYDAGILTSERNITEYFESAVSLHKNAKNIANWIINEMLGAKEAALHEEDLGQWTAAVSPASLAELVKLIDEKVISNTIAKKVFSILKSHAEKNPRQIVEENNWQIVSGEGEIDSFVTQVLEENADEVQKYLSGKTKVFGFLMGQLMKISKGKVDPTRANQLMQQGLERLKGGAN